MFTNITKLLKNFLKNSLHKSAFIPKYSSNKSARIPFGGHFLKWSKTSFVEKADYAENGEARHGDARSVQIDFCY